MRGRQRNLDKDLGVERVHLEVQVELLKSEVELLESEVEVAVWEVEGK